jgi:hypothetical protein
MVLLMPRLKFLVEGHSSFSFLFHSYLTLYLLEQRSLLNVECLEDFHYYHGCLLAFVKHDLKGSVKVYRVENWIHYPGPLTDRDRQRQNMIIDVTEIPDI